MEIANLAPDLARLLGIQPSTLVLLIFVIVQLANLGARLIPNDATGFWGGVRKVCAFVGLYVSSRVTGGVTVNDVTGAALKTPAIERKVEAAAKPPHQGEEP